ncbi:hypothetical protein NDA18_005038 [Ustilago nuda]|nr:hypothetical protein NDA18_005038 [Ustilago nuda]
MPLRNDSDNPDIWASSEGGIVSFPAFVRLPASARSDNRRLLLPDDNDSVKNITLSARLPPHYVESSRLASFRQQIAARWSISEERIRALTVNLDGKRVLIEDNDDWEDWVATYFFHPTPPPSSSSSYASSISRQQEDSRAKKEFRIKPVHINIMVESPPAYAEAGAESWSTQTNDQVALPMVDDLIARMRSLTDHLRTYLEAQRASNPAASTTQRPDQPRTQIHQPQREAPAPQAQPVVSEETWHPLPIQPTLPNASDVVGSVLQAIQPQLRDAMPLLSGLLSSLPGQLANPTRSTALSQQTFTATPAQRPAPPAAATANPGADTVTTASNGTNDAVPQQRQSLIEGLFNEISHVRSQRSASEQPRAQGANTTSEEMEGEMSTVLSQAFAEMLARQRSAPAPATATSAAAAVPQGEGHVNEVAEAEEAEESITVVSTPSTSSRRSSRSRSRSHPPAANRSIFATTTLFLTLFTFILSLVTPTFASPSPLTTSLNPRSLTNPLNTNPLTPRTNSRNLHLCKCTCFQINSTLVPLYSPSNPAKPCATCTRQFCLDQGLEICKGAKLEHTDHDTGTGLEGDVWAKCFERDSRKDQNIITLYLLVVVGLVAFAAFRGRVEGWVRRYEELGPRGLYSAVRDAPWRRGR